MMILVLYLQFINYKTKRNFLLVVLCAKSWIILACYPNKLLCKNT